MSSTLRMIHITVLCFTMVLVTLGAVSAGTMSEQTSSLIFDLSVDTVFVENTTGDSTLEWAAIQFSLCDSTFDPTDELQTVKCKFSFDVDKLNFQDAVPTENWDTAGTGKEFDYEYNDSTETLYLVFEYGAEEVPDSLIPFATIHFTTRCFPEDSSLALSLLKDQAVNCIEVNDTTYYPDYTCGTCYDDGAVRTADYIADFDFQDTIITDTYGEEFLVPVRMTSNFRTWWVHQSIEYDTSLLYFAGLEDADAVFAAGCEIGSYDCPDSGDYPISFILASDGQSPIYPLEPVTDTVIYNLKFIARSDTIWDGQTTLLEFISDSCRVSCWDDSLPDFICPALSFYGYDFDPDDGHITLEDYTASFKAVPGDDNIYVGGDYNFDYHFMMKNRFTAGMPSSDSAYLGAIQFNLTGFDDADYEGKTDLSNDLYFKVMADFAKAAGDRFSVYQAWDTTTGSANAWGAQEDFEELITLTFEFTGDPPDSYGGRYLTPFDYVAEALYNNHNTTARVSTVLLDDQDDFLVVADSVDGTLDWDVEALEVTMGEFYSDNGSGDTIYQDLIVMHNFDLYDFTVTITTSDDYDILSIDPAANISYEVDSCSGDCTSYRIYSDSGASWSATGNDSTVIAEICYVLDHYCYCDHSYRDTVVFSDMYMKDSVGTSYHCAYPDDMTLSVTCPGCHHDPPSCPVLFAYDGDNFIKNNPLLTACEAFDYKQVVTDFYHVRTPVNVDNGVVRFQLQEMEEETTFLENVTLYTIDHSPTTQVACAVDGTVNTFTDVVHPLSAVDHNGKDQLALVGEYDNSFFVADEPGHLIVTFPNTPGRGTGYHISAAEKKLCTPRKPGEDDGELNRLTVETMDSDGNWVTSSIIPPREEHVDEIITCDADAASGQDIITIRISWTQGYATDAVTQFVASDEQPQVYFHTITDFDVSYADPAGKIWSGFKDGEMLVMSKGDVLNFSFEVGYPDDPDLVREFVICAQGRYEPNYLVFGNLLPDGFYLGDAYPNPFNPTTTIEYAIPVAGEVKLEVFNLLGQKVSTLVDGLQEAGGHSVDWNSTDESGQSVASGVYFYRLTTDNFTQSKKMILVK